MRCLDSQPIPIRSRARILRESDTKVSKEQANSSLRRKQPDTASTSLNRDGLSPSSEGWNIPGGGSGQEDKNNKNKQMNRF